MADVDVKDIIKLNPDQVEKLAEALQLDPEEVEPFIIEKLAVLLEEIQTIHRRRRRIDMMSGNALLTPDQAAETLQVEPSTVKRWLRQGRLAGIKPGKEWRIRESDLQEFLLKQKKD